MNFEKRKIISGGASCPDCNKEFVHPRNLQQHRRSAHEGMRYYCNDCDVSYTRAYNLTHHRLKTHPDKISYEEAEALRKKYMNPAMAQKIKDRYKKEKKHNRLSTGKLLRLGLTRRTTDDLLAPPGGYKNVPVPDVSSPSSQSQTSGSDTSKNGKCWMDMKNKYRCMLCPFSTHSILNLRCHASKHAKLQSNPSNKYTCKFCDFATKLENTLLQHIGTHFQWNRWSAEKNGEGDQSVACIAPPMRCVNCDRSFPNNEAMLKHEVLHYLQC